MKTLITAFLLLICTTSFAQKRVKPSDKARAEIGMLKGGALLVRLKTSDLKINALKSKGMLKEAELIRIGQESTNKQIVEGFWKEFHFCKVYFFYSNNSEKIKSGNHKGYLMNVNMEIDSSFTGQNYLIGEFDESEVSSIDAFVIKDKNFDQMKKPFPFMIKLNQALVTTRSYDKVAVALNEKLFDFYGH